jgi:multisubunit Na+/H+ antiporter MnhC subunit
VTEAIIITAIIVGGIVALAWVFLHFAFKAWKAERVLSHDKVSVGELHVDIPQPVSVNDFRRKFDLN